ncbi:ArsR family transcriptional regulator [[Eubacterium] rectale]|nr:ArsR family transcriptional regulator [Agathobacter rectalis]
MSLTRYCSHLTVRPATITAHLKCLYEAGAVITQ